MKKTSIYNPYNHYSNYQNYLKYIMQHTTNQEIMSEQFQIALLQIKIYEKRLEDTFHILDQLSSQIFTPF